MKLEGARILVTGGASGIGLACSNDFARAGAKVWSVDRDAAALSNAREASDESAIEFAALDVRDPDQIQELIARIESTGGLDVLINNAAVLRDQALASRLGRQLRRHSIEDWNETLACNLTGTFLMAREVSANWIAHRRTGLIVNVSSVVRVGNAGQSAYSATKAAVDALTVTWSRELAVYGIRVAAVAFGFAHTGMTRDIPPLFRTRLLERSPFGRFGDVHELVHGVRFVIENDYFVGRVLELDGGMRF